MTAREYERPNGTTFVVATTTGKRFVVLGWPGTHATRRAAVNAGMTEAHDWQPCETPWGGAYYCTQCPAREGDPSDGPCEGVVTSATEEVATSDGILTL